MMTRARPPLPLLLRCFDMLSRRPTYGTRYSRPGIPDAYPDSTEEAIALHQMDAPVLLPAGSTVRTDVTTQPQQPHFALHPSFLIRPESL